MLTLRCSIPQGSQLILYLTISEFILTNITLGLLLFGYPSTTRSYLWKDGGAQGFNSDPRLRIYFYANHLEPPPVPYLWSQAFTDLNLSIAILSFWLCFTRLILLQLRIRIRVTELFLQTCVLAGWILSVANQLSGDTSDAEHSSVRPWYLTHHCSVAHPGEYEVACRVAQAGFVGTVFSMALSTVILGVISVGNKEDKEDVDRLPTYLYAITPGVKNGEYVLKCIIEGDETYEKGEGEDCDIDLGEEVRLL